MSEAVLVTGGAGYIGSHTVYALPDRGDEVVALDALRQGAAGATYNCGYGRGLPVREVVRAVEKVTGKTLPTRVSPRRPGDPPTLISDPGRIKATLGWKPAHDGIDEIINSAIAWEKRFNR